MTRGTCAAALVCAALLSQAAGVQNDQTARFDVASVRRNESGAQSFLLGFRNGRFTALTSSDRRQTSRRESRIDAPRAVFADEARDGDALIA